MKTNKHSYLLFTLAFVVLVVSFSACTSSKKVAVPKKEEDVITRIENLVDTCNYPKTCVIKMNMTAPYHLMDISVSMTLSIIRGEGMMLSVKPFLGMECVRIIITPEEMMAVNRLNNRFYKKATPNLSLEGENNSFYNLIESVFLNRPYLGNEGKTLSEQIVSFFVKEEKESGSIKMSRAFGDSATYSLSINKENRLDTVSFSLLKRKIYSTWGYGSFFKKDNRTMPYSYEIKLGSSEKDVELSISVSDIVFDKKVTLNKSIPSFCVQGEWNDFLNIIF
ncbi:MAG TPA: hypothetical protein DDY68_01320 [Porphyromonadaceae bacterium]|nr:hypothetical protein [Porphyromonadaceae bacterium]